MNTKIKEIIPIAFCFDTNYVIPASVAFYSLLEHANNDYFYEFYILHSDITIAQQEKLKLTISKYEYMCNLNFVNMENRFLDIWEKIYGGGHFSKEVMYKLLLASIFPMYEKIVVSDVDVVFLGDISKSYFDLNSENENYFSVVKAIGKLDFYLKVYENKWEKDEIKKIAIFCGGYLVANLKKIREDKMESVFIDFFEKNGSRLNQMEQDVLNMCCFNKVNYLKLNYVACTYLWDYFKTNKDMKSDRVYSLKEIQDAMDNPLQLHYATGIKPWKNPGCTKSEIWYEYIAKTPFHREFLESLPKKIILDDDNVYLSTKMSEINKGFQNRLDFQYQEYSKILSEKEQKIEEIMKDKIDGIKDNKVQKVLYLKKIEEMIKLKRTNFMNKFTNSSIFNLARYIKHNPTFFAKKDFYRKVYDKLTKNIKDKRKTKETLLIVFDDIFPSKLSSFRYEEFNEYQRRFDNVLFALSGTALSNISKDLKFETCLNEYKKDNMNFMYIKYPFTSLKTKKVFEKHLSKFKNKIAYNVFLNNVISNNCNTLELLKRYKIPFIFTLYPGGGFVLNNKKVDEKLRKILSSKLMKKVIVTQKITYDYITKKELCNPEKIECIWGIVTPNSMLDLKIENKLYYDNNKKKNLDICFVAYKYSQYGKDKGYDLFIKSAKILFKKYKNVFFHVVGNFDENVIDVRDLKDNIKFYGIQKTEWFENFYKDKDIYISPNRHDKKSGVFDGFPTGAGTEAALNKLLLVCTDELNQNMLFKDNEDIILIEPNTKNIVEKIEKLYLDPTNIKYISNNGYRIVKKNYSKEKQINGRINIIKNSIKEEI